MALNEADTRAKLIDPAIRRCGWTEDHIKREQTAGRVEIVNGNARRRSGGRMDYVLRVKLNVGTQPVAVALVEAKREDLPADYGLEQAKDYATRLNVGFVFSSNGHQFVEYDHFTGLTASPRPMSEFPTPDELRTRYEQGVGFALESEPARPLLQPYPGGEGTRWYYQDAAIRAVMEKIARCESNGEPKRALLSMATGCGKTFIAVNLLKRISDARQMTRALFLCDRDELRTQGSRAFQEAFGSEVAAVRLNSEGLNDARNARVHVATYQTLGVAGDDDDANFLTRHYPENYFSHVIIDECHRSAWGKWSQVLTRNSEAAQIGLTATPRRLVVREDSDEAREDAEITANNVDYFGEPVYEYGIGQGISDGYLAACEVRRGRVSLDITGVRGDEIRERNPVYAVTGEPASPEDVAEQYDRNAYEATLMLPDRVQAMCEDLLSYLLETGGPEQKTIIFCTRDQHADAVSAAMNNLYAEWCAGQGQQRRNFYAFKCTAAGSGNDHLPDFRGSSTSHFVATTVDLLTTGVDVPGVRNVVFFRYLRSPILFYQMVGRGTRIDVASGKLMFRVYDYTNATRLFAEDFIVRPSGGGKEPKCSSPPADRQSVISVAGFDVRVTDAGRYVVSDVDGAIELIPMEAYKAQLAARLLQEVSTVDDFRNCWADPQRRTELVNVLERSGYAPEVVRTGEEKTEYDLYDVLAELVWGVNPRTRQERADAFGYKNAHWLDDLPSEVVETLHAIAELYASDGVEGLENPLLFRTPAVVAAGGLATLQRAGNPAQFIADAKQGLLAA